MDVYTGWSNSVIIDRADNIKIKEIKTKTKKLKPSILIIMFLMILFGNCTINYPLPILNDEILLIFIKLNHQDTHPQANL